MKSNNKIVFIAEFLLSFPGGGEHSIFEVLKQKAKSQEVICYTFDSSQQEGLVRKEGIKVYNTHFPSRVGVSRFMTLYKNRNWLKTFLEQKKISQQDHIITQTLLAAYVADFAITNSIPYTYYIRDELQVNEFHNYEVGVRFYLKIIKNIVECRSINYYKKLNERALAGAHHIVSNSNFIQTLLKKKFGVKSTVSLPSLNRFQLKRKELKRSSQRYITFVGAGNMMKGYDIALTLTKKLPQEQFLFVGKGNFSPKHNIMYQSWSKNPMDFFKKTKLLIVPSRWQEAYGRVVAEAVYLGIPVISSNQGGIAEAQPDKNMLIQDFEDVDLWVEKINQVLNT